MANWTEQGTQTETSTPMETTQIAQVATAALESVKPCSTSRSANTKPLSQRLGSHSDWATGWRKRHLAFEEPTKAHERVAKMVQLFTLRVANNDAEGQPATLVLYGGCGGGKSHLARKAGLFLSHGGVTFWHDCKTWGRPPQVATLAWSDLIAKESEDFWQQLKDADVAVIDEIGGEVDRFKTGGSAERLRQLLEARDDRWTILTTNLAPDQWEKAWDARVASRLKKAIHVGFQGIEDFRTTKTVTM